MGPYSLSINACLHILKYDYEFLICILRKMTLRWKKALIRSLKYPSLPSTPLMVGSPFRVGRRNAEHFRLDMAGLENLHNFRAPLVLKAKLSVVLATSSKFCISEQRLEKCRLMSSQKKVSSLIENVKYDRTAPV